MRYLQLVYDISYYTLYVEHIYVNNIEAIRRQLTVSELYFHFTATDNQPYNQYTFYLLHR